MAMTRTRFSRDLRATSAVEFAIIAPFFLLFIFGMTAYGIYFGASHSVQQIAADAARASVAGLDEGEREAIVERYVEEHAGGYPLIDPARLSVSAQDDPADAGAYTVALTYDARTLPIWNLMADLPVPGKTIVRRSVIRMGGL